MNLGRVAHVALKLLWVLASLAGAACQAPSPHEDDEDADEPAERDALVEMDEDGSSVVTTGQAGRSGGAAGEPTDGALGGAGGRTPSLGDRDAAAKDVAGITPDAAPSSGCSNPPATGLRLWLRADEKVEVDAEMRVIAWGDHTARGAKAAVPDQPALAHDPSANGPFPRPTAPRLIATSTYKAIRFDGRRDELELANAPRVTGLRALSFVQVAATRALVKPGREWCQDGLRDPILENGCSGTYWTAILWPSWGVPGYSGAMFSLMQESVTAMFGTGVRDQKFYWIRPQSVGDRLTAAIAVHDGPRNQFFVDGNLVHSYPSQDGKDVIVNAGPRIQFGVGRFDRHWSGDLAEFLIYDRALAAADVRQVDDYLRCRYPDLAD